MCRRPAFDSSVRRRGERSEALTRTLSKKHNHTLKDVFKGAATTVIQQGKPVPIYADYERLLESGTKPNLAKLTLARKIAAIVLHMWKEQEVYRAEKTVNTAMAVRAVK